MNTPNQGFYEASQTPIQDLDRVAYQGQDPSRRRYVAGYERFMNQLPILKDDDLALKEKLSLSTSIMNRLAKEVMAGPWLHDGPPADKGFDRIIVAIESSSVAQDGHLHEGKELIVARWGTGFTSPVHGHAEGFMHEGLLTGRMLVNLYCLMEDDQVRLIRTDVYQGRQELVSSYGYHLPLAKHQRQTLIHSFTALAPSTSLHYVPEHTRDGRDNTFEVEHFEQWFGLNHDDLIHLDEAMNLPIGSVVLVRSENVPEYGDHYIVITGHPVLKEHGLRPQDVALQAPHTGHLLDAYTWNKNRVEGTGLTLLKLDIRSTRVFHQFHGIRIINGEVTFPKAL